MTGDRVCSLNVAALLWRVSDRDKLLVTLLWLSQLAYCIKTIWCILLLRSTPFSLQILCYRFSLDSLLRCCNIVIPSAIFCAARCATLRYCTMLWDTLWCTLGDALVLCAVLSAGMLSQYSLWCSLQAITCDTLSPSDGGFIYMPARSVLPRLSGLIFGAPSLLLMGWSTPEPCKHCLAQPSV